MIPSAVQELMTRISELQQPPPAIAQFAGFLTQQVSASGASGDTSSLPETGPVATATFGATGTGQPTTAASTSGASTPATSSSASVSAMRAVSPAVSKTLPNASSNLPAAATPWLASIRQAATKAGIDPNLLTSLVWVESSFQSDAVSPDGAIGLAQLMPDTAKNLGVDPHDPKQNVDGAARMLAGLIEQFGRVDHALAAYNVGPNGVTRGLAEGRNPGAGYAKAVADKYRTITGKELF